MIQDPGEVTPAGADELDDATARLLEDIARIRFLPVHVSPADALSATLCTLSQRVSGGQARDFASSMAPGLQALLRRCVLHREEKGESFDRDGFVRRVAAHLRVSPEDADWISRAVFRAVQARMSSREVDDLESQLPPDLKQLWRQS